MKIYDIIREAPEAVSPGGIVIPAGAKTAAPTPKASTPTPSNAGPQISNTRQTTRKITSIWSAMGDSKAAKITSKFAKFLTPSTVTIKGTTFALENLPKVIQISAGVGALLKWLSVLPMVYGYAGKLTIIDDMVSSGELDKDDLGPAQRLLFEELVLNIIAGGQILKLAKLLISAVTGAGWATRIITGAVAATTAVPTGGGSIAAAVAGIAVTTVAITAINFWLASEAGQEMMAKLIVGLIDPAAVAIYNVTFGTVFGEIKKISTQGEEPVKAALSSSPSLKGTVAGKPEINRSASQGAKSDDRELTDLEKLYYSQPKSMFDPRTGALLPSSQSN